MRFTAYITILISAIFLLLGCEDEANFSSNSNLHLSVSTDTLVFEPQITERPSSSRTIMVWNRSGEDLRISQIDLCSANNNFQINVDGRSGSHFKDVEILNGDSLYIFVRANISALADTKAALIEDSILLKYNGNVDKIILSAVSQNAIVLKGYTVEHDTTWTKEQPFLIFDSLKVAEGATLTLKAGTTLLMHNNASIKIDGTLDIQGKASDRVCISGDRLDNITANISYTKLSKQWNGILFSETSTNNIIEGLLMRGSTTGLVVDSAEIKENEYRLVIANSEIRNSSDGILTANNARIKAYNSILANGGRTICQLAGGEYLFNFCTIANIAREQTQMQKAVCLTGSEHSPISNATFNNCIIKGVRANELDVQGGDEWCNYKMNHCLAFVPEEDSTHFINCKDGEARFFIDYPKREYDFHIDSTSAARKIGDTEILKQFPECATDLDANPRDSNPDAGAYTYTEDTLSEK